MSQNISLWGASYSNVPSVTLPKTGGGTASFTDVTDTTATASDVVQGKYFFTASGQLTLGTNAGGSGDGYVWQDGNGYVHLSDEEGTQPIYDTLNVNASGTFTPSQGHAYNSVVVPSGTAGTPSASKGTVTNHAVTVTPSVTNQTGWITGATKTGTGVSVSASELVSGTKSITENGTGIDVTNYASVDVDVPTGGSGGLEYEAGIWTPSADTYREGVSFSNSHTKAPSIVIMADVTGTAVSELSSLNILFVGVNCTDLFGNGFPYGATTTRDYFASYAYRTTTGASAPSCGGYANISNTSGSTEQYVEYWATNTEFYPYTRSTSRNWIAGRTYKWLAIWK